MTMERFKKMKPYYLSPVDIILEWKKNTIKMHFGESQTVKIELLNDKLNCLDESVDKIIISDIINFNNEISKVLMESKRVLKKNGRIFIVLDNESGAFNLFCKMRSKFIVTRIIDEIERVISEQHLLIDKNYIFDGNQIYLEIVKLESDYLKRKIVI